jgi:hypothetical protein
VFEDILVGIRKLSGNIKQDGDNEIFLPLWSVDEPVVGE